MIDNIYGESPHESFRQKMVEKTVQEPTTNPDTTSNAEVTDAVQYENFDYRKFKGNKLYPSFTIPIESFKFSTSEVIFQINKWLKMQVLQDGEYPIVILINLQDTASSKEMKLFINKLKDLSIWIHKTINESGIPIMTLIRGLWFDGLISIATESIPVVISSSCIDITYDIIQQDDINFLSEIYQIESWSINLPFQIKLDKIINKFENIKTN